jgi:CRISPR-associated endoribonuclease Cas6
MPAKWFVPIRGIDPDRTRLEHLHAAFSGWFDRSEAEHEAGDKPYSISPLTERHGQIGVVIGTMTEYAARRVCAAGLDEAEALDGAEAPNIRLGNQWRSVGRPVRLKEASWRDLARDGGDRQWRLDFLTPVTFRSGDRSSPLPSVATVVDGLARAWRTWCEDPLVRDLPVDPRGQRALWVSDLDLRSSVTELKVGGVRGRGRVVHLSGAMGSMTLRVEDEVGAAWAGPLLRLAPFCGVGSMRAKGFGVVEVSGRRGVARGSVADEAIKGRSA